MAGVGAGSLQRRPQPIFPSRKLASLRTLPRGLAFAGSPGSVQKQLGNAVPSLLAEVIARAIAAQFFDGALPQRPAFAVTLRRPISAPERVQAVAKKYLDLQGDHAEHPGTGKGYAAVGRRLS